ncbi:solute carrier family 35 member F6 isoform X3 [Eubalaena glacialis]|uniref:solute carrier family 35 member F6 isoform X3 n=1 Tax=Eubalaena glacialis TaxID=27606 RepID=UPI002A5A9AE9|nr:solute carrier family 35 member F6 isoform X3 [Eubalaena glacialis]
MAWTKYQLFLAGLMLVTGSINTLSAKWADNFVAPGCGGSQEHSFQHPFLQAVGMFLGEFSCLAAFYLLRCRAAGHPDTSADPQQPFNPLLFLPPALCDMTGTSIMYVALNMTSASSFQMLRGAVIIFTGLFSVTFLGRRLALSQWLGILATIAGLVVVGLADLLSKHDSQHKLSEVITATQTAGSGRGKECMLTEHLPSAQACFALCRHHCHPHSPGKGALQPILQGPADHHGPDHRLHPDGAGGEVCLQAQRAPTAGSRHGGPLWLRDSLAAAGAHVLHPCRFLQWKPSRDTGGRAGRLLPGGPTATHRAGAAGQHQQHRLLQLCRHQCHQGAERHHPNGAGQPAYHCHLGPEPDAGLGGLPSAADPWLPRPAGGHSPLQRAAPPALEPPVQGPAPGGGGRA